MQRFLTRNLAYQFCTQAKVEAEITSVDGHRPPVYEDTVQGKYAGVLFRTASQGSDLHNVLQDMKFFQELNTQSLTFRDFLNNIQFSREQQESVFKSLESDQFTPLTWNFLNTLIENKRIQYLPKIAEKYIDYYRILNKEENITIISANELGDQERQRVVEALKKQNPSVQFTVQYQVDPSILGGLQMYSGNKFLDCSLISRVQKIRGELQRISF